MNRNNTGHRIGAGGNKKRDQHKGRSGWSNYFSTKKKDGRDRHAELDSSAAVPINAGPKPTLARKRRQLAKDKWGIPTFKKSDAKMIFEDLLESHIKHHEVKMTGLNAAAAAPNNNKSGRNNNNNNNNKLTPNTMVMNSRKIFWKRKFLSLSSSDFIVIWNEARNKFMWHIYHGDAVVDVAVENEGGSYSKDTHGLKNTIFSGSIDRSSKFDGVVTSASDILSSSKSGSNANANANGHCAKAAGRGQKSMTPQPPSASLSASLSSGTSKSVEMPQVTDNNKNNFVIDLCDSSDSEVEDDNNKSKNADSSVASSFEYADDEENRVQQVEELLARIWNHKDSTIKELESETTSRKKHESSRKAPQNAAVTEANNDPPATTTTTTTPTTTTNTPTTTTVAAAAAVAKPTTVKQPRPPTNRWSKLFLGPDFRTEFVFSLDEGDEII